MNKHKAILIVGGYGEVGRRIAGRLMARGIGPVRIAGRNRHKADAAAESLGCEAAFIDLADPTGWPAALDGVDTIVSCVDQTDADFVAFVLGQGMTYVDITADDAFFRQIEQLDAGTGRAILSVGLAPGLTNLLVASASKGMKTLTNARIGVLLGLGDLHGPAAIDWTLRNLAVAQHGKVEIMAFGEPARKHPAIPFDFADQHVLRRTLGLADTRTLLTFDSRLLSRLFFALLRPLAASPMLQRLLKGSMLRVRIGSDRTALAVEVTGEIGNRPVTRRMALEGRGETSITALVAALTVEHLRKQTIAPGVHHVEQVLTLDALAQDLTENGVRLIGPETLG